MTVSTSLSGEEHIDVETDIRHLHSRSTDHRVREFPVSEIPEPSGAPLETWVNAHYEPACVHDLYYDSPPGESSYLSSSWSAAPRCGWVPQTVQTPLLDGTPAAAPRSRQRQHARVINVHPRQADQDDRYRPTHSFRVHQVPQAAAPSHAPDSASSPAYRSTSALSQSVRGPSRQQEPPLRNRDASVSSRRSSDSSSNLETPSAVDNSRRGGSHTARTSLNGGQDPVASQPAITNTLSQGRRPRSEQISASRKENLPNAGNTAYIHVDSRPSSRSRSSSRTGSSPSTTFSRTRGPPSSVPSSPATSFSIPSAGSSRDSGYSSGGSVCEPEVDKQSQHRQGDSRYPPNSHDTRHGGYDAMQDRRRKRRARARLET